MEKRFFLAIFLSFMVLFIWTAIMPKPIVVKDVNKASEVIENKQDIENKKDVSSAKEFIPSPSDFSEKIEILKNNKITVDFSNLGGNINKIFINEYEQYFPVRNITGLKEYDQVEFSSKIINNNEIQYFYENEKIKISKFYKIRPDEYIVESKIKLENKDNLSNLKNLSKLAMILDMSNLDIDRNKGNNIHDNSLFEYAISIENEIDRKAKAFKFTEKENKVNSVNVNWVGFRDRFFSLIVVPEYKVSGYSIEYINEKKLAIGFDVQSENNNEISYSSLIFAGPEITDILKKYNLLEIKRYYRSGFFDAVAKAIDHTMNMIYKVIPNWGVCIILISIIIYLATYPLTIRSLVSMKKMQALQPLMKKIQEKHKNSPQKANQEIMELYKEHKINPLGGCLPMLLQMPIFVGLYQVLWRSVSFKGADFLWIKDLSLPDRIFILPASFPIIGNEINILPILMIFIMFYQQKLTSANMASSDPMQVQQQKMMMFIFPLMLGFLFYRFASGLTLYFTMFYLLSTITQLKISRETKVA